MASPPLSKVSDNIPPSLFTVKCHPRVKQINAEHDGYFLQYWPFENQKAREKFIACELSTATCLFYPTARDDRIQLIARLITFFFFVDDLLEDMSFDEGLKYNENLISISRGYIWPNRAIPEEWILYDIWESMRAHDKELTEDLIESVVIYLRATTDKIRLDIEGIGPYLKFRERDVGKHILCSGLRFVADLHLSPEQLKPVAEIEQNFSNHITIINDIYSFHKECQKAQTGHVEGATLCSAVQVLHQEANLSYQATKKVLLAICREWEENHVALVGKLPNDRDVQIYIKGIEYMAGGNEEWSATTMRYNATH
ncbi:Aristolochene synthase [Xylaria cf. heliscus]|nr:Aristolochene synthase [Xylaria cf. heliscus]